MFAAKIQFFHFTFKFFSKNFAKYFISFSRAVHKRLNCYCKIVVWMMMLMLLLLL